MPSYCGYDAIIHLNTGLIPQVVCNPTLTPSDIQKLPTRISEYKNVPSPHDQSLQKHAELDFLIKYIDELQIRYKKVAFIFADMFSGDKVCIKWKNLVETRTFSAFAGVNLKVEV